MGDLCIFLQQNFHHYVSFVVYVMLVPEQTKPRYCLCHTGVVLGIKRIVKEHNPSLPGSIMGASIDSFVMFNKMHLILRRNLIDPIQTTLTLHSTTEPNVKQHP
jgi:hypothetical protein